MELALVSGHEAEHHYETVNTRNVSSVRWSILQICKHCDDVRVIRRLGSKDIKVSHDIKEAFV